MMGTASPPYHIYQLVSDIQHNTTMGTTRYFAIIINALFMVNIIIMSKIIQFKQGLGLTLLLCGMICQVMYKNYLNILNDEVLNLPVLMLLLGVIISMVSVLGLLGAVHNNITIITIYIFTVVITLTIQLVLGMSFYYHMDYVSLFHLTVVLSFFNSKQVVDYVQRKLISGLMTFTYPGFQGVTETWNVVQHEVHNYYDTLQ